MPEIYKHNTFAQAVSRVDDYLREKFPECSSTISTKELKKFPSHHQFVRGWRIRNVMNDLSFKILIPQQFPYAIPRVAIEGISDPKKDFSKKWPHIEDQGMLCLSQINASMKDPVGLVNTILCDARDLIEKLNNNPEGVSQDFRDEFLSYWGRNKSIGAKDILSLLHPDDEPGIIYMAETSCGIVVGSRQDNINNWCVNRIGNKKYNISKALYIKLEKPPIIPFFDTIGDLESFLKINAPSSLEVFYKTILSIEPYIIIFSALGNAGVGFIAISINPKSGRPNPTRGFRGPYYMSAAQKIKRMIEGCNFARHQVIRVDHEWVHGRGKDENQKILKEKIVTIIGCGALGSHVAVRLAQSGIGQINLIDPELLESANVGRHSLGMKYLRINKANMLCHELRERFPHLKVYAYAQDWQTTLMNERDIFTKSNLIVSLIGEWRPEAVLNEWHISINQSIPIVYGWTETRAVVSHAVLIKNNKTCLQCLLNESGEIKYPHSEGWVDGHGLQFEPACGSVFQPFGSIDIAFAEALVSEIVIGTLLNKYENNMHAIHATSQNHIDELGGRWTNTHLKLRPHGFDGSFQHIELLERNQDCPICTKKHD